MYVSEPLEATRFEIPVVLQASVVVVKVGVFIVGLYPVPLFAVTHNVSTVLFAG